MISETQTSVVIPLFHIRSSGAFRKVRKNRKGKLKRQMKIRRRKERLAKEADGEKEEKEKGF